MAAAGGIVASMVHLDLDLLRTFVTIADTRSLTRTAGEVGRTQSAISMQVKRLEDVVGGPVLHRTSRGVELTALGERLLAHAHRLLKDHDAALADLTGRGVSGVLRLGCPEDYAVMFLPPLLRDFSRRHPLVSVELVCAPTTQLRRLLDEKRVDMALVSLSTPDAADEAVVRKEPLVWVGSPHHALAASEVVPVALSEAGALDHRAAIGALTAAGRRYRIAFASNSMNGLIAIVRSGIAVAVLTETAVPADLRVLGVESTLPALPEVYIAVARGQGLAGSALVQAMAEHIRQVLPALP